MYLNLIDYISREKNGGVVVAKTSMFRVVSVVTHNNPLLGDSPQRFVIQPMVISDDMS